MPDMEIEIEDGVVLPDDFVPPREDDDSDYDDVTYVGKGEPIPEDKYNEVNI